MGVDVSRLIVEKGDKIINCWQLTFHPVPFTPFCVGYFPKGPMPDELVVQELMKLGKKKNAIYIQLEPNVPSSYQLPATNYQIIPSHHPLFTKYTFILDLTKSEEELLKIMHQKTRYNIRLAQKHGVTVKEDSSDQAFNAYLTLSDETTNRQGFYAHNHVYHQQMWQTLKKDGLARLFTASFDNKILAAWIIFCFKDTIYYPYGASSRDHREVMAPTLMLWELMRWGKTHGYKKFDLWGALGSNPDQSDPWYGFHRFKEGYHPLLIEFVGSYDLIVHPLLYKTYCLADTIRWTVLKMKI